MFVAWLLAFAFLYVFFGEILQDMYNPNTSPETISLADGGSEIILQQNRYGHYLVSGEINGTPVSFMLDTGATTISVPAAIANEIGLSGDIPTRVQTANGVAIVYQTRLDEVSIGAIRLHDIRANINPNMGGDNVLLGMSFLKHLDFSQTGRQLKLRKNLVQN